MNIDNIKKDTVDICETLRDAELYTEAMAIRDNTKYLIDIIEQYRELIKRDEKYLAHLPWCDREDGCDCGLVELGEDRFKTLKLTEE